MPHPCETAELTPHKAAIIMADSGEIVSYAQLDRRSNQIAQLFRAQGLSAGDHIALMLENSRHFLEICFGAQRAGLVYTPISTHLKSDEVEYILRNCGARLFVASMVYKTVAAAVRSRELPVTDYLMVGGIQEGYESWEEAVDLQAETPIADQTTGVDMLYSSGTTGRPKGVKIAPHDPDFRSLHPAMAALGTAFGFSPETTYLSPAPLYHAAPLRFNMMNLMLGGTSVIMERFDPERALQLIEEHHITHSQWVPIMFVRMLKLAPEVRKRYDLSSMQLALHAAAPCPVAIKRAMIDWWGEILVEYYAASEGIGLTLIDSRDWLEHPGSVGKALIGQVHILDDAGAELPPGEIGTVYFSGSGGFSYHGEPEKTQESYDKQGRATTHDLGYVDADGYLYLTDRKHFMIISGGVNIYPQEVENLLINHEKVADVAVFGIPSEEFGEEVKAVVQPVDWSDATDEVAIELLEWLRERIAHLKVPGSVDFSRQLPREDNGKLYKRHLVDAYRAASRDESRK